MLLAHAINIDWDRV